MSVTQSHLQKGVARGDALCISLFRGRVRICLDRRKLHTNVCCACVRNCDSGDPSCDLAHMCIREKDSLHASTQPSSQQAAHVLQM
jgi:hypothetical protein